MRYWEDFEIGAIERYGAYEVTEAEIVEFATAYEAMAEHDPFMRAINDRDVARASILMRDHVLKTGFLVGEFVRDKGDASPEMLSRADRGPN